MHATEERRRARPESRIAGKNSHHLLIVFLAVFLAYSLTTSHSVGLEDDGLFILSSHFAGISHPPGYPLFTLSGHLFSSLPFATMAFKVHLASAFFGALACVALWWCTFLLVPARLPAYASAFTFGFSSTFWSQSVVAEVYSLNCLFFFLILGLCLRVSHLARYSATTTPHSTRQLAVVAFVFGLSLTNHWPLMVLASPAFMILLWPARKLIVTRLHVVGACFLLGLTPYVWMIWRSQADPVVSFYGPIRSFAEFWFVFSREGYKGVDSSATAGLLDKALFASHFIRQCLTEVTFFGFLLAALGFVRQWKRWGLHVSAALLAAFACSSFLLIVLLGFDYDELHVAVFRVYPLVSYGVLALWLGLGVSEFSRYIGAKLGSCISTATVSALASALVVGISLATGFQRNNLSEFTYPGDYATAVLETLPPNAVLFAKDDVGFGTIAYLHLLRGMRPDISLYQLEGLVLDNRLFDPRYATQADMVEAMHEFLQETQRPVYLLGSKLPASGYDNLGLYARLRHDSNSRPAAVFDETLFSRYRELMRDGQRDDTWLEIHRGFLSYQFGWVLGVAATDTARNSSALLNDYPEITEANLKGLLGVAAGMISRVDKLSPDALLNILRKVQTLLDRGSPKDDLGNFLHAYGVYFLTVGNFVSAEQQLQRSIDIWPHPDNPSIDQLIAFYRDLGRTDALSEIQSLRDDLSDTR